MATPSDDGDTGVDDGPDPDGTDGSGGSGGTPGLVDRIRSALAPPAVAPGGTKRAIEQLDDRERRLSFLAAGLAVVFGVLIYLGESSDSHFRLAKGQLTPQTTLVVGLVSGALLFAATLWGRRAPVGFVSLFAFFFFGTRYFVGVPFLLLGGWLLYRSFKVQKEAAALRKAGTGSGSSSRPAGSGRVAAPSRADRKGTATRPGRSKGPAKPEANKRYTPKRPPPPAPKPSRKERKAAASD